LTLDTLFLSRIQFALTIGFHYIFPPINIGLSLILVVMEGLYLKTGKTVYHDMARFWVKIFALCFSIGVATGIVMEFEFGTNWAEYSRFVGDVFGSALASEGIFAFFLESGFLAVLLFGWDKVGRKTHFLSTVLVSFGAHFSAIWIIVANSWMQTPAGYVLAQTDHGMRAQITDFWAMVFNPSSIDRLSHVIMGAWQAGAWFVLSVSAYYLLKNKHTDLAKRAIQIALVVALVASLGQLVTGHASAIGVSRNQPAKLAAFEGHYASQAPADMYLFGWVNERDEKVQFGLRLPRSLSLLVSGNPNQPVTGLRAFSPTDRPPVNIVFQAYHIMVAVGMGLIGLALWTGYLLWRLRLEKSVWTLRLLVASVLGPQIGNQFGWISAEVGRQPWIVQNMLRTRDAFSKTLEPLQVFVSLILFGLIYLLLFVLFIYLLDQKIRQGPKEGILSVKRAEL